MWGSKKQKNRFVGQVEKKTKSTKNKKKSKKTMLIICFIASVIVGLFLVFSNFLNIEKIVITETSNIDGFDLEKVVWDFTDQSTLYVFSQNNLLLLDKDALSKELNKKFQIEKLTIKKRLPNILFIELVEKDYSLIWLEDSTYYYINNQGDIILTAVEKPEQGIIISNLVESKKQGRVINVDIEFLQGVHLTYSSITEADSGLVVSNYVYDEDVNTIKLKIEEGPLVYFNTEEDVAKQVSKLLVLRKQVLLDEIDFKRQLYIDLRYGDRVFYQ